MKYINVFLFITLFTALVFNSVPFVDCVLGIFATIITVRFIKKYPIKSNMGKYIVLLNVWVSVVMMPAYHLVVHILHMHEMTQVDYDRIQAFGYELFFLVAILILILGGNKRTLEYRKVRYYPRKMADNHVKYFFYSLYALTAFCYVKGIGRLGGEPVQLPFHLSGIINLFRQVFVPTMFVMLIEGFIIRHEKVPKKYILMYFVWTVMETFAWMSKGVLFNYMFGLLLVFYWYYRPSMKKIVRYVAPFGALVLFLYPILGVMRSTDSGSFIDNFMEAKNTADEKKEDGRATPLLTPLNRVFLTGQMYAQDYSFFANDSFFEFSRVPTLYLAGGAAGYQTRIIDGYPDGAHHSSGTSGIMDPLLHGGKGFCFIIFVFLVVCGTFIDKQYSKMQFGLYISLFMYLHALCSASNISVLYDAVGLQHLIVTCASWFMLYLFNYKRKMIIR